MAVLERVVANLVGGAAGSLKRKKLHGRSYVVAPTVMLTEGVHTGSQGPGLYLKNEMEKHPDAWNHKPIVVYHPEDAPTACDPDVLDAQQVGILLNTKYDDKLRTEAWLDEERCKEVDPRILEAVENGETMEVSTGLYVDQVKDPVGVWNGEKYDWKATNLRPDHLAILPDKVGACSVKKGAGLLQLNEASFDKIRSHVRTALSAAYGQPGRYWDGWIEDIYKDFVIFWDSGKLWKVNYSASDDKAVLNGKRAEVVRVSEYKTRDGKTVANGSGKTYSEVEVTNVKKKEKVDLLVKNSGGVWDESDREELMKLDDKQLDKMLKPVQNKQVDEEEEEEKKPVKKKVAGKDKKMAVKNEDDDPDDDKDDQKDNDDGTDDQKVPPVKNRKQIGIEDLDPRLQAVINEGLSALDEKRTELISAITENKENEFSEKELKKMTTNQLKKLAKLAKKTPDTENDAVQNISRGRYDGAGMLIENDDDEEIYAMPEMTFNSFNLNGTDKK